MTNSADAALFIRKNNSQRQARNSCFRPLTGDLASLRPLTGDLKFKVSDRQSGQFKVSDRPVGSRMEKPLQNCSTFLQTEGINGWHKKGKYDIL